MAYSEKVIDHYTHPRNVGTLDKAKQNVGTGLVGAPECGDVMRLQIEVDENNLITDAKFKTFGCGSAIASSSLATEWLKGKRSTKRLKLTTWILLKSWLYLRLKSTVRYWLRMQLNRQLMITVLKTVWSQLL